MKASFQDYFRELIGDGEAEQFFSAITDKNVRRGLRVNSLKIDLDFMKDWLAAQGYEVSDCEYSEDALEISGRGEKLALKLPYHAGFTYPQDPSSMFAVELLDPQPGETVLDLTAAPGGKSTHIAQKMKNTGVLMANDLDSRRLKALHSNLERLGIWNTVVTRLTGHKLSQLFPESFDRVLLDPSCSGEGLLVTRDGKPSFWSSKALRRYSKDQFSLLCSAFRLLKPGGRLVYSTCTLNAIEDDGVVEQLLEKFPEAKIEDVELAGMPEQIGDLIGIRFWPQKTRTKGFFCVAITKTESIGLVAEEEPRERLKILNSKQVQEFSNYLKKSFGANLPEADFVVRNQSLFVVSKELASFSLPRKYSLSFPILKIYENEFRTTHAGAIWLGLSAKKVLDLDREEVEAVFERQPIKNLRDKEGLFLAKFKDFPLGLAKLTEKRIEVVLPKQF